MRTYSKELVNYGEYPLVLSDLMGNYFYMARFDNEKDALLFKDYVTRKADESFGSHESKVTHQITGEDKRMLDDRKRELAGDDGLSICDKHIDGA